MTARTLLFAALAVVPVLGLPTSGLAISQQDVQYESVTRVEFQGALGTMARLATRLGGGSNEWVEKTYIKGNRMRTDSDQISIILHLDEGRFIQLDHSSRTYSQMTLAEMLDQIEQARQQAADAATPQATRAERGRSELNFRLSAESGNQRERIAGYQSDRFFLTLEAEGKYYPDDTTPPEEAGTLVVLIDDWSSKDMPAYTALAQMRNTAAHELAGGASQGLAQTLTTVFAGDPNLRAGFQMSMDELNKLDGISMRSALHFVIVAPEKAFNRELALQPPAQPERPSVAQQAGRAALGGLTGGLLGGNRQQPPPQPPGEPTQVTIVKATTEIRNVVTTPLDPGLFEIPADYRRR